MPLKELLVGLDFADRLVDPARALRFSYGALLRVYLWKAWYHALGRCQGLVQLPDVVSLL